MTNHHSTPANGAHLTAYGHTNSGPQLKGNNQPNGEPYVNGYAKSNGYALDRDHYQIDDYFYGNGTSTPVRDHATTSSPNGHTTPLNGYSNDKTTGDYASSASSQHPIAICGIAMRLPGGVNNAEAFWDVLFNGKDLRTPIPANRYNALAFSNALGKKSAIKTQYGYFLDHDLSRLDASFFSMTQTDLERTDPQQRLILEVTRECLENAGEVEWRGKPIGCYVGTFGEDWLHSMSKENQFTGAFAASGDLMIANRVSYEFDFTGPRYVKSPDSRPSVSLIRI